MAFDPDPEQSKALIIIGIVGGSLLLAMLAECSNYTGMQ